MIAKYYVCENKCKPEVIIGPVIEAPICSKCGKLMVEGQDE